MRARINRSSAARKVSRSKPGRGPESSSSTIASNAAAPVGLQVERLQVELARPGERGLRDREVLDREPGGVEERDVGVVLAAWGLASQHGPELGDVPAVDLPCLDGPRDLAPVAGLFEGMYR